VTYPENILYCSTLCSEKLLNYIFKSSYRKPLLSTQKFHRLFVAGLRGNEMKITALSAIPITRVNHKKKFWINKSETTQDIKYIYIPFINYTFFRQLCIIVFSCIFSMVWCMKNSKKNSLIICDILNVSMSTSVLLIGKLFGFKTCGIVTDLPQYQFKEKKGKHFLIEKAAKEISVKFMRAYDSYVILTEQMNDIVNPNGKPFVVIEGLADIKMGERERPKKDSKLIILYSGGIYEKYGVKNLINAFKNIEGNDLQLSIYGAGEMESSIAKYCTQDPRIKYFGIVSNDELIEAQQKATLLVNPRFSKEEYTKYSFPSKNMEYLVSGTPALTSSLPGMPKEYLDYFYLIEDETEKGIESKLREILQKSVAELSDFGEKARRFVIENKNNITQTEKFLKIFSQ